MLGGFDGQKITHRFHVQAASGSQRERSRAKLNERRKADFFRGRVPRMTQGSICTAPRQALFPLRLRIRECGVSPDDLYGGAHAELGLGAFEGSHHLPIAQSCYQ